MNADDLGGEPQRHEEHKEGGRQIWKDSKLPCSASNRPHFGHPRSYSYLCSCSLSLCGSIRSSSASICVGCPLGAAVSTSLHRPTCGRLGSSWSWPGVAGRAAASTSPSSRMPSSS